MADNQQVNRLLNSLRVEIHGHVGVDVPGAYDITQFVSALRIGHSVAPPWDTMTISLRIPRHLLDLILPGENGPGNHRHIQTGAWVAVRASPPTGATNQGTDRILHGPVIGLGCIETISFGFQSISGIGRVEVEGTTPVLLQCISWFTAAGRSNLRLAITDDKTSRGGVQDATTWFPVIVEAIKNSTDANLGYALQQLWELVGQVDVPSSILPSMNDGGASFGRTVPVVYDVNRADRYAPTRRRAMLPVRGQGFLNLPVIQPESDLWQWLGAIFVPDANMVELFPSLEFPQLTTIGTVDGPRVNTSTSIVSPTNTDPQEVDMVMGAHLGAPFAMDTEGSNNTPGPQPTTVNTLGQHLHGAQPVLIYRLKPFLMHPINQANWKVPTVSEKLGVNQQAVDPSHHGAAQAWYSVEPVDTVSFQITFSEADRVNLTFARPTMVQTGSLRPYTQFGKVVMPDQRDFNRYGLRAYEPMWPFIPEGTTVDAASARSFVQSSQNMSGTPSGNPGLIQDFEALNELVWALCGEAEKFAHASLTTRARPWCRAGHWMSGRVGEDIGDGNGTMQHWTGYIESVEHIFEVDAQARWHSYSTFNLSRVSFDRRGRKFFTPTGSDKNPVAGRDDDTKKKDKKEKQKSSPPQKSKKGEATTSSAAPSKQAWLDWFYPLAKKVQAENPVFAQVPLAVCLGQAALESGYGTSNLARLAFNFFGLTGKGTAGSTNKAAVTVVDGVAAPKKASLKFAKYNNAEECIRSYFTRATTGYRYPIPAYLVGTILPPSYITWIWARGYTSEPGYPATVISVANTISDMVKDPALKSSFSSAESATLAEMKKLTYGDGARFKAAGALANAKKWPV